MNQKQNSRFPVQSLAADSENTDLKQPNQQRKSSTTPSVKPVKPVVSTRSMACLHTLNDTRRLQRECSSALAFALKINSRCDFIARSISHRLGF